jgi:hypothetical protein
MSTTTATDEDDSPTRFRVTITAAGTELRGYATGMVLAEVTEALEDIGLVIISPAEDGYDPFSDGTWREPA